MTTLLFLFALPVFVVLAIGSAVTGLLAAVTRLVRRLTRPRGEG
jgi:hypothetical protein